MNPKEDKPKKIHGRHIINRLFEDKDKEKNLESSKKEVTHHV